MKVIFRVDASVRMGTGHLLRCLTLAESLQERGVQVRFICREHSGNLIALLRQKAIPVTTLPAPGMNDMVSAEDYAVWLGMTQAEDAEQTIEALNGEKPEWLVVDHYGLDAEWEQRMRPYVSKLMVIDDLANRFHDCDILLDQNYSSEGERRYAELVPETCKLLVGPLYALLRPEYAMYRKILRGRDGRVKKVLVFFGGSDPHNMTGKAIDALSHPTLKHLGVDVVVGANNPHRKTIEQQILHRPLTTLYNTRSHLADLMSQADFAIGAGGVTTLERMCLGLPTVVVSIAENQIHSCIALHSTHYIDYLGCQDKVDVFSLANKVFHMIDNPCQLIEMSLAGQALVDGYGADIVNGVLVGYRE
ncbi:MAG: UDP-2,4-diacetamido-2,4,6-trideoxy-beta-L-altropyranose hydrolase [Proteobacteria bacterium]|nr:UDP-2,4-diacetamido-2,4,6-trideoxy-beta-L-altropyranose hydrolase [Pseudomonadota bacterium]MBU2620554.1 UDP-2,4-diacetamido-2,4,6-trideoxy-beta-L-altropyranose hydrolase [Pseudomonadota bacterium]